MPRTEASARIRETMYKDAPGFRLTRGLLSVTVLRRGGKLQCIDWGGRELLCQRVGGDYRFASYGDVFETGEFSGFDDMFPTISACQCPSGPWAGTPLPDHGEVWTQAWACEAQGDTLLCRTEGLALPYRLEKRVSLLPDTLVLDYTVENLSGAPMPFIWAAHPLFVLEDGMTVELEGCRTILNAARDADNLGDPFRLHDWPVCASGRDLRRLDGSHHTYRKFYAWNPLPQNRAVLRYPDGTRIVMDTPVETVPYLGLWVDEAGYGGYGMRCVAPEPCTAAPDRLDLAEQFERQSILPPRGQRQWRLTIRYSKEELI